MQKEECRQAQEVTYQLEKSGSKLREKLTRCRRVQVRSGKNFMQM
jgi:IS1 family transposase